MMPASMSWIMAPMMGFPRLGWVLVIALLVTLALLLTQALRKRPPKDD
jgi:hypothetical protein